MTGQVWGVGRVLAGRTELIEEIGRGSTSVVYSAWDHVLEQAVAAKVLSTRLDGAAMARFAGEQRRIVDHPNVASALDWFHDGVHAVALFELFEHGSLQDIHDARVEWWAAVFDDVLDGLSAIHDTGLLHLDVTIANVMLRVVDDASHAVLGDLGSALRARDSTERFTASARIVAPEIYRHGLAVADPRSDLFALGALARHGLGEAAPQLDAWVARLSAADPGDRFATALEAQAALRRCEVDSDRRRHQPRRQLARPAPTRRSTAPLASVDTTPLLAREAELRILREEWRAATTGRGRFIVVGGHAGVGKTRLAETLATEVVSEAGVVVVHAEIGRALGVARDVAQGLDDLAARDTTGRGSTHLPGSGTTGAMALALRAALTDAAQATPVLVLIDDVQWADPSSLEVLTSLGRAVSSLPVLFLMTARTADEDTLRALAHSLNDDARVLPVEGLTTDAVGALLTVVSGASFSDLAVDAVWERTRGNPFLVIEVARSIPAGLDPVTVDDVDKVPAGVLSSVARRLGRLPDLANDVAEAAALSTHDEIDVERLAVVVESHPADVLDACYALTAESVLRPSGRNDRTFRFVHALVRDALREQLSAQRTQELHRSYLRAHEAQFTRDVEALAYHALHARSSHQLLCTYAYEAARACAARGALSEAVEFGQIAVEASAQAQQPELALEITIAVADYQQRMGEYDLSVATLDDAIAHSHDDVEHASLLRHQGYALEKSGQYERSLEHYTRGIALVAGRHDDPRATRTRAELELGIGVTHYFCGAFEYAYDAARRGLELAEQIGHERLVAQACLQLEMVCSELGRPERDDWGQRAVQLWERLDDPVSLGNLYLNLGVSAYNDGSWQLALDRYERAFAAYVRAGDAVGAAIARNNQAEPLTDQGRLRDAKWRLLEANETFRMAGYQHGVALTTSGLSRLALREGRSDEAQQLLGGALTLFAEVGSSSYVTDTQVRQLELLVYQQRWEEARALAETIEDDPELAAMAIVPITRLRLHAWADLALGDLDVGIDRLRRAAHWAHETNARYEEALALDSLAPFVDDGERSRLQARAGELFESLAVAWLPDRPHVARRGTPVTRRL